MTDRLFTQSEVNKIFGHISPRTLRFWVESGLVQWAHQHEDRRGIHREYSTENLWQLGLAEELMDLNLTVKDVKYFMLIFDSPHTAGYWQTYSLIIPKGKARRKEEYDTTDNTGHRVISVPKTPGFHFAQLVPTKGLSLDHEAMEGWVLVILVNLKNVVERVNGLVRLAGV